MAVFVAGRTYKDRSLYDSGLVCYFEIQRRTAHYVDVVELNERGETSDHYRAKVRTDREGDECFNWGLGCVRASMEAN